MKIIYTENEFHGKTFVLLGHFTIKEDKLMMLLIIIFIHLKKMNSILFCLVLGAQLFIESATGQGRVIFMEDHIRIRPDRSLLFCLLPSLKTL